MPLERSKDMQIICVDDHPVLLEGLVNTVKRIVKNANVQGFTKAEEAYAFAKQNGCDILFCEIQLYADGGMTLAEKIRKQFPRANIIFTTVCSECEYAKEVIDVRLSGYITNPVTKARVLEELHNLRYPIAGCLV
jgi:DNA-binding NarL/FixJ family response regulator